MNYFRLGSYMRLFILKDKFSSYKNKKILDIGTNYGEIAKVISLNNQVIGLDTDKEALVYARKHCRKAKFIYADAVKLPFVRNTFDIVICLSVLEHIKDEQKVLKEISRVLKPKGELILTVPNKNFLLITPFMGKLIRLVNWVFKSDFPSSDKEYVHFGLEGIGHVRRGYKNSVIKKMLVREKMRIIYSKSYWHFPSRLGYIILTPLIKKRLIRTSLAKFIFRIFLLFDNLLPDDKGDILIIAQKTNPKLPSDHA